MKNRRKKNYRIDTEIVLQPVDHQNPGGETFPQRVKLLIPDGMAPEPTVFFVLGNESAVSDESVTRLYRAYGCRRDLLIILAEHRGYGQSLTADGDQSVPRYVTVRQALADYHRIADTYRNRFGGRWIAAGYSYGGGLVIHYGALYPGDADVLLSSSGVVDWPYLLDSYEGQVKENLGGELYSRLIRHVDRLTPAVPFGKSWRARELLYAMITGVSQYEQNHTRLLGLFRLLAKLPTRLFMGALRLLDRVFAASAASDYVNSNSKCTLSREEALSGRFSWRVWRYQQFTETGTCWHSADPSGLYRYKPEDWAWECELLFGIKPTVLQKESWDVRSMVPKLRVPLVYVCGGRDPWKTVCLPRDYPLTKGRILYFDNAFHCPDRDAAYGSQVIGALLDMIEVTQENSSQH